MLKIISFRELSYSLLLFLLFAVVSDDGADECSCDAVDEPTHVVDLLCCEKDADDCDCNVPDDSCFLHMLCSFVLLKKEEIGAAMLFPYIVLPISISLPSP